MSSSSMIDMPLPVPVMSLEYRDLVDPSVTAETSQLPKLQVAPKNSEALLRKSLLKGSEKSEPLPHRK